MSRRPDDCCICFQSTAASTAAKKKRLVILGRSAQSVHDIIKAFFQEHLLLPNFSCEEPHFHAEDFICSNCISLLTNYHKTRNRLDELKGEVKTLLQASLPATMQQFVPEPTTSPISPPLRAVGRRTRASATMTSTKRLRVEPRELPGAGAAAAETARVKVTYHNALTS